MSSSSEILLFDSMPSSYAQKVRIALREKGIPFRSQPGITPNGVDPELAKINPRGEVPTLVHAGTAVIDSTVILEYLEDAFPDAPALLPPRSDPAARARARIIEDLVDTHYEAVNWGWGEALWMQRAGAPGSELYEQLKREAVSQTNQVYAYLTEQLGEAEWFGGSTHGFGWADVAVAPFYHRSVYYGFTPPKDSPLDKWYQRVRERKAVRETFDEFDAAAPMMYKLAERFISGQSKREYRDHRLEFLVRSGGLQIVQEGVKKGNVKFSWPSAGKNA